MITIDDCCRDVDAVAVNGSGALELARQDYRTGTFPVPDLLQRKAFERSERRLDRAHLTHHSGRFASTRSATQSGSLSRLMNE